MGSSWKGIVLPCFFPWQAGVVHSRCPGVIFSNIDMENPWVPIVFLGHDPHSWWIFQYFYVGCPPLTQIAHFGSEVCFRRGATHPEGSQTTSDVRGENSWAACCGCLGKAGATGGLFSQRYGGMWSICPVNRCDFLKLSIFQHESSTKNLLF